MVKLSKKFLCRYIAKAKLIHHKAKISEIVISAFIMIKFCLSESRNFAALNKV